MPPAPSPVPDEAAPPRPAPSAKRKVSEQHPALSSPRSALGSEPLPLTASRLAAARRGRLHNLDLLRGLAALAVCAGHLRAFMFVDFGQVTSPTLFDRLFYFATGLGHQAVVVFFVLSGYLVGGSVIVAHEQGRWSWRDYAVRRLTRLWVVLIPALLLTLVLDTIARHYNPAAYDGAYGAPYNSGPQPAQPADLRISTFLGNLFFLQTIRVNCFGTNGPLWSLANEFWYYLLFPLIWTGIVGNAGWPRAVCLGTAALPIWWLPSAIVTAGLIWLTGVAAFALGRSRSLQQAVRHPLWLVGGGVLALGSLVASKRASLFGSDWNIGLAFGAWVVALSATEFRTGRLTRLGTGLSEMSYTLYLIHFPILAALFFSALGPTKAQSGLAAYATFGVTLGSVLALAAGIWWCFERNTDRVRRAVSWRLT